MSKRTVKPTGLPFWSWNDELKTDKLIKQIRDFKEKGYGGFFMHARSGLKTEYLSKEWFDCVKTCCKEAKKLGLDAWAYDENGWPSGFVGGKLLENKDFRLHYLNCTKGEFDNKADMHYLVKDDALVRSETPSDGFWVNVYDKESVSLVDILNDEVVDAFINETHERYKSEIKDLSENIVGFFTDEPLYCEQDGLPFPTKIREYFAELYGEDIYDSLGLLFSEQAGYERFRYRYYKCCQELFLKNFAQKLYSWHDKNGLKLTGHYVEERDLYSQMLNNAGIMPFYEFMHIPGIDWLCRRYMNVSVIRQLTSVTAQLNKEYVLSEMFAMTGWDVTPKELKSIADYQYNYGVNVMCQHLVPYSEKGERKNDYPAHFSSFNAWVSRGMAEFNRYFDALGQFIRDGSENVEVGVLFNIRSAYLKYDFADWMCVEDLEVSYIVDGCENLANHHVAFHILDETLLARHGGVENGKITLGKCSYTTLVIPKVTVIDKSTDDILRDFVGQGGKVLLLDGTPRLVEGEPAIFDYLKTNVSFEEIFAANEYQVSSDSVFLHTSLRSIDGKKYLFAVNIGDEEITTEFYSDGARFDALYDVVTDKLTFVGKRITIPPKESVIVCDYEGKAVEPKEYQTIEIGGGEYTVVDFNANYMALDFARLSYDGVNFEAAAMPVVGIFRRLLAERYCGAVYLKYGFTLKEIPENISLLFEDADKIAVKLNGNDITFDGISDLDEIYSRADISGKVVAGENVMMVKYDFYQDENVYYALFGEGVSESIKNCMTYNTMIAVPYLSGKFGVYSDNFRAGYTPWAVHADTFYVGKSPEKVVDLVEQGFPFFAGNITLKREFVANSDNVKLRLNGRFHYAEIAVNGQSAGSLMFTDTIDVSDLVIKGKNILEIKLYSGNRNLLGPHHCEKQDVDVAVGPYAFDFTDTWKENGSPEFTARYSFSKFGLFDK